MKWKFEWADSTQGGLNAYVHSYALSEDKSWIHDETFTGLSDLREQLQRATCEVDIADPSWVDAAKVFLFKESLARLGEQEKTP